MEPNECCNVKGKCLPYDNFFLPVKTGRCSVNFVSELAIFYVNNKIGKIIIITFKFLLSIAVMQS